MFFVMQYGENKIELNIISNHVPDQDQVEILVVKY